MSNKGKKKGQGSPFAAAPEDDEDVTEQVNKLALSAQEADDDDDHEHTLVTYPPSVIKRLVALKQVQEEVDKVEQEYKKERAALEQKYHALRNPMLEKRSHIVSGQVEVDIQVNTEGLSPEVVGPETDVKGVPEFWAQAIRNHPTVGSLITEEDIPALRALVDIKCAYNETMSAFTLTFLFEENEFFTNTELVKNYILTPDLLTEKTPGLETINGTKIDWKPKKNLCVTETRKKQKGKKGGQVRFVTKTAPKPSFFHYFSDPIQDEEDMGEDDEEEEGEGKDQFQLNIDEDYEVAHAFRTEIIPDGVLWFTGEAIEDDDFGDDELDDIEEGDEEDGDEDDDDEGPDAESSEVKNKPFTGFGAPPAAGPGGAPANPECKQS